MHQVEHNSSGRLNHATVHEAEYNPERIPIVKLAKATARHNERMRQRKHRETVRMISNRLRRDTTKPTPQIVELVCPLPNNRVFDEFCQIRITRPVGKLVKRFVVCPRRQKMLVHKGTQGFFVYPL